MYTRLSQETGMALDYELPVGEGQAPDWRTVVAVWRRLQPKTTKTGEVPCAQ